MKNKNGTQGVTELKCYKKQKVSEKCMVTTCECTQNTGCNRKKACAKQTNKGLRKTRVKRYKVTKKRPGPQKNRKPRSNRKK